MRTLAADEMEAAFLSEELDTAGSMLEIARSESSQDRTACQSVVTTALAALGTIGRLEYRIEDSHAWREVHFRARELKFAFASLCTQCGEECEGRQRRYSRRP